MTCSSHIRSKLKEPDVEVRVSAFQSKCYKWFQMLLVISNNGHKNNKNVLQIF